MTDIHSFRRIKRLPPYVFNLIDDLKKQLISDGVNIFDFSMGNPNGKPPQRVINSLKTAIDQPGADRYSVSRGIEELREAICAWYQRRYQVDLDPESETIVTLGSKEGLAHLALATMGPGDVALVPNPSYPIHAYGFVIAGADVRHVPLLSEHSFLTELETAIKSSWPSPKMLVLNFPANPTTQCVNLQFFEKIVQLAKLHNIWVVHDFAYADIVFKPNKAPSILQVPGAKEVAVESYTLSKSYNMAGWRVGFLSGNSELIAALGRMKSYLDYGIYQPIQQAALAALNDSDDFVKQVCETYKQRRNCLCKGLNSIGWHVNLPEATLYVWAKIPDRYLHLGSLEFSRQLLMEAKVSVSPGIGFGEYGNDYVRFALVEDEPRIQQAVAAIERFLRKKR